MKLFLATNSMTAKTVKIKMLEHSVLSAIKNTNFDIFVIFDGKKEELNLPKSVQIIEHRHRCYETFKKSKRCIEISSGTFLRTEIPFIIKNLGMNDEYCMYTDYDVLFQPMDCAELDHIKPKYFAACPEFIKDDWSYINAGVMLMNIKHFLEKDNFLVDYINNNFESLNTWDQTMYNNLYKGIFDKLPLEYNWKPYWGINSDSKIIHFHGPKPKSIIKERDSDVSIIKKLRSEHISEYEYYNQLFESYTGISSTLT